jgi:hypothetical protein
MNSLSHGRSEPLRFPRGVRLALREEIPRCTEEILQRIAGADIRSGFTVKSTSDPGYSSYLEANVHADHIGPIFADLVGQLMPDFAAPLITHKDEEATFGPYTRTQAALAVFAPYAESLSHDGFLEFGMIYQRDGHTEEVLVTATKHFKIWTHRGSEAIGELKKHGLLRADSLQFIDEFPRTTERLPGMPTPMEVATAIVHSFGSLPDRDAFVSAAPDNFH